MHSITILYQELRVKLTIFFFSNVQKIKNIHNLKMKHHVVLDEYNLCID